jgi:anti-anti-sigma factor
MDDRAVDAPSYLPPQPTQQPTDVPVRDGSAIGVRAAWSESADWLDLEEATRVHPLAAVDVEQQGNISVARLRGEIDTSNVSEIGEALGAAAVDDRIQGMVVDLSGVAYLNSATVKLLFDLAEQMHKRHQQMRLVMTETAPMRKLILLLKFDLVVPLDKTIDDAFAHIRMGGSAEQA